MYNLTRLTTRLSDGQSSMFRWDLQELCSSNLEMSVTGFSHCTPVSQ